MPLQSGNPAFNKKRTPPPDETFEEAAYLKALGEKQKIVSLKLADGEVVRGWIEYYDKNMVRVTREDGPNLFIFKHEIVYIAEDEKEVKQHSAISIQHSVNNPDHESLSAAWLLNLSI